MCLDEILSEICNFFEATGSVSFSSGEEISHEAQVSAYLILAISLFLINPMRHWSTITRKFCSSSAKMAAVSLERSMNCSKISSEKPRAVQPSD
jgi:hypothetical protein